MEDCGIDCGIACTGLDGWAVLVRDSAEVWCLCLWGLRLCCHADKHGGLGGGDRWVDSHVRARWGNPGPGGFVVAPVISRGVMGCHSVVLF